MFKKFSLILFLVLLGLIYPHLTYASVIFSDPVLGPIGSAWNNPAWIYHDSLYGTYDTNGAHGHYYPWRDVGTQNQVIKWVWHYGNAQDIVSVRCRISYDGLNTEQITYYPNSISGVDEGVNGIYTNTAIFTPTTIGTVNGELDCIGNTLIYKENSVTKIALTMNPSNLATGVGFYSSGTGDTSISNIQICDENGCDNQPSLSVPLLKQTDSNWGGQIYDSANLWATAPHQTIGDWGCALTSATMVLQYNKITKLPDGTNLDPRTLNTWLKNQKDGYVGNGLVNWLALSRLSKLAKPQNPNFTADALEYKRKAGADTTTLLADLNAQQPDILEEPGHFVVGTGQSDTSFTINDPYYSRTDLTQGYNNTFLSLGRYIPSHTDLSYMMFVTDESTNLELKDATGSAIGESFDQQPLINDTNDSSGTASGSTLHEYLVPQPPTGTYSLHVSGADNAPYYVKIYMYDKNGNVIDPINLSGFLDGVGSHTSEVVFDNQSISNDFTITNVPITIDTFMEDLIHYEQTGDIKGGFLSAINILADNAKNFMLKFNIKIAKVQLRVIQGLVTIFHNKGVSNDAYNVLNFELQYLLNNL